MGFMTCRPARRLFFIRSNCLDIDIDRGVDLFACYLCSEKWPLRRQDISLRGVKPRWLREEVREHEMSLMCMLMFHRFKFN